MRLVIDANIVIAAIIKDSKSRQIITSGKFELFSPDFILEEVSKHKKYICKKSGLSQNDFDLLLTLIFQNVIIVPLEDYKNFINEAKEIIKEDIKDAPYVACYLSLKCEGIWTSDPDFDNKSQLEIYDTNYLMKLL